MKKAFLCGLLLIFLALACAQEADYADLIAKTRRYLTVFPEDQSERLTLAYYYMLNAQPDSALAVYEKVLETDSFTEQASSGRLWALNTLGRYAETVTAARDYIRDYPSNPDLRNHLALAWLRTDVPLTARTAYRHAHNMSAPGDLSRDIAVDGLAWSYFLAGDVAKAEQTASNLKSDYVSALPSAYNKPSFKLSVALGWKDNSDTYFQALAGARIRKWSVNLEGEEYSLAGNHYRTAFKFGLSRQFVPLEIGAFGRTLSGVDEMVYPAWQTGIGLKSRLYVSSLQVTPRLAAYYAYYPSFSSLQADIGLMVRHDRAAVSVSYSGRLLDNEAPDSENRAGVLSTSLDLKIWKQILLSLYHNRGDMSWWTSPYGVLFDSFVTNDRVYGVALTVPLSEALSLNLYQQIGTIDETSSYLGQGQLTFSF